jgi:hypothetical protein
MQTDDTLMLKDDCFAKLKKSELKKANLMFKKRKMLITLISIRFNDEIISLIKVINKNDNYSLSLIQFRQFDQIRLINMTISVDIIDLREQNRKMITSTDQYVVLRARNAYIIIMIQSKVSFDLFLTAQVTYFKEEDAKRLNKRL